MYPTIHNADDSVSTIPITLNHVLSKPANEQINLVLKTRILNLHNLVNKLSEVKQSTTPTFIDYDQKVKAIVEMDRYETKLKNILSSLEQLLQRQDNNPKIYDAFSMLNEKLDILEEIKTFAITNIRINAKIYLVASLADICINESDLIRLDKSNVVEDVPLITTPVAINTAICVGIGSLIYSIVTKNSSEIPATLLLVVPTYIAIWFAYASRCARITTGEYNKRDELISKICNNPLEIYNYIDVLTQYQSMAGKIINANPEIIKYVEKYELLVIMLRRHPSSFQYIDQPTLELCMKLIEDVPNVIGYIPNPTDDMYLITIKNDPSYIKKIINPSEKLCLTAVKLNYDVIEYITNPTDEMYLIVVKRNPSYIKKIVNPSEKVCLKVLKKNHRLIEYITNPTESMLLIVIRINPSYIKKLSNPTEKICLEAVTVEPKMIEFIENPTEEMNLIVIAKDPLYIKKMINPSQKVCFAAVRGSHLAIKYVEQQTLELCIMAAKQYESHGQKHYLRNTIDPSILESSEYLQRLLK